MKRKNFFATSFTCIMMVSTIVAYHVLADCGSLLDITAKSGYTKILTAEDGPGAGAEKNGMIETGNITFYYSTNSALTNNNFVVLSATDAKTPGVLMNLSVINGLFSIKVTFSGGPLYAMVTKTFFEDYTPEVENALTSDVNKSLGGGTNGYLMLMTTSLEDVTIDEITINYSCVHEVDQYFIYDDDNNYHVGARSMATDRFLEHDAIRFTTNPSATTNNYSSGSSGGHANYWYRFNGVSLRNYAMVEGEKRYDLTPKGTFVGNTFDIVISVMVDPSIFYSSDDWYCVAPWVSLATANHEVLPDIGSYAYMQSYIGNDNIDPIGGLNPAGRSDTYRGRFFTNYASGAGGYEWGFQNPDTTSILNDPETTLREAYETINLPFFNIRYSVDGNYYAVYINSFKVYEEHEAFYLSTNYTGQGLCIETIELQAVNYGDGVDMDEDGPDTISTPLPGYGVAYANPIVYEIIV